MRIGSVQPGRPEYYDRNPVGRTQSFNAAAIPPHGGTVRWTYTVPSAKKAFTLSVYAQVVRELAAAPASAVSASIGVTPSGGSAATITQAVMITNAVGDQQVGSYGATGALVAGDAIAATTVDFSTGGSADYYTSAWLVEFDA